MVLPIRNDLFEVEPKFRTGFSRVYALCKAINNPYVQAYKLSPYTNRRLCKRRRKKALVLLLNSKKRNIGIFTVKYRVHS